MKQATEEGYLVVNPEDRIYDFLKQNSLESEAIRVSKQDSHSNPIRHRFLAEEPFERITGAGLLQTPEISNPGGRRETKTRPANKNSLVFGPIQPDLFLVERLRHIRSLPMVDSIPKNALNTSCPHPEYYLSMYKIY